MPDIVISGQPVIEGDVPRVRAHVALRARVALAAHEIFGEDFERDGVLAGISKGVGPVGVPALARVGRAGRAGRRSSRVVGRLAYLGTN